MSESQKGGLLKLVLVAGILTLAVNLLRVYGELHGWDPVYFNTEAGGHGAVVGIAWLVPIFGFLFGRSLAKAGKAPGRTLTALVIHLLGFVLAMGVAFGAFKLITDVDQRFLVLWITCWVFALFGLFAWPAAFFVNLLYGVLARGPVVVLTHLAFTNNWDTHMVKLGPGVTAPDDAQREFWLMMAQATAWMGFTILVGGFFAVLGAATVRKAQ